MNSSDIAKAYGVVMDDDRSPKEFCNWDGKQFNTQGVREDGRLHELGHWAISNRRHLPDFGLGPGPDTNFEAYNKAKKKLAVSDEEEAAYHSYDKEETLACVIEFIHGALCGHDMRKYMEDRFFLDHNGHWDDTTGSTYLSFMKDIHWLQDKKIISKNWVPLLLRSTLNKNQLKLLRDFKKMVKDIPG